MVRVFGHGADAGSALAKRVGASGVTVRLVDYGQTVLQAVAADPDPEQSLPARTGPAGRAFSGQEPVVEEPSPTARLTKIRPVMVF